jgi:hypothetical protein
MVYIMTSGNGKMIMNNEFGEKWEEVVVDYFKVRVYFVNFV